MSAIVHDEFLLNSSDKNALALVKSSIISGSGTYPWKHPSSSLLAGTASSASFSAWQAWLPLPIKLFPHRHWIEILHRSSIAPSRAFLASAPLWTPSCSCSCLSTLLLLLRHDFMLCHLMRRHSEAKIVALSESAAVFGCTSFFSRRQAMSSAMKPLCSSLTSHPIHSQIYSTKKEAMTRPSWQRDCVIHSRCAAVLFDNKLRTIVEIKKKCNSGCTTT